MQYTLHYTASILHFGLGIYNKPYSLSFFVNEVICIKSVTFGPSHTPDRTDCLWTINPLEHKVAQTDIHTMVWFTEIIRQLNLFILKPRVFMLWIESFNLKHFLKSVNNSNTYFPVSMVRPQALNSTNETIYWNWKFAHRLSTSSEMFAGLCMIHWGRVFIGTKNTCELWPMSRVSVLYWDLGNLWQTFLSWGAPRKWLSHTKGGQTTDSSHHEYIYVREDCLADTTIDNCATYRILSN